MDESLRTRLILAARAGKLTEEQYQIYLQLLEDDEEFREEVEWEDFLEDALPVSMDAELYEASEKRTFPEPKNVFQRYSYAIAASVALLLLAGGIYFALRHHDPVLVGSRKIDLYNGDNRAEGQLGYSEGDLPAGELVLKWWRSEDQQDRISYRFCNDTLQLYFREPADTIVFNNRFRLSYLTGSRRHYLESKDSIRTLLENCADKPKSLLK